MSPAERPADPGALEYAMRVWKQLLILLILVATGVGGFVAYSHFFAADVETSEGKRRGHTATVEVSVVRYQTLQQTVEAVGTTRARNSIEIRPLATGTVAALSIKPGQLVQQGATLAKLDTEIQQADLVEAQALLVEQRRSVARMDKLRRRNAVAAMALEQATAKLAVAQSALQRAERRLQDRTITAPFAGVVGLTNIEVGAQVDQDTMITRLDNLTEIEIEFSLPEMLFGQLAIGRPISAQSAAFPDRRFNGQVSEIDSRIDSVSRSFKLRASLPNPDGALPAGMFMSLELVLSETKALVVPEEAIVVQAADTFVFLIDDGKANRTSVTTGMRKDGVIVVSSGLAEGQQVVIRGLQRVRDKGAVKIKGAASAQSGKQKPRS